MRPDVEDPTGLLAQSRSIGLSARFRLDGRHELAAGQDPPRAVQAPRSILPNWRKFILKDLDRPAPSRGEWWLSYDGQPEAGRPQADPSNQSGERTRLFAGTRGDRDVVARVLRHRLANIRMGREERLEFRMLLRVGVAID